MTKEKANRNEVVGMFLTYCRKTLVNARTDVLRERKRRRNREVLFCDLRRSELESLADWQTVPGAGNRIDRREAIGVTDKTSRMRWKTRPGGAGNHPALLFCRMVG